MAKVEAAKQFLGFLKTSGEKTRKSPRAMPLSELLFQMETVCDAYLHLASADIQDNKSSAKENKLAQLRSLHGTRRHCQSTYDLSFSIFCVFFLFFFLSILHSYTVIGVAIPTCDIPVDISGAYINLVTIQVSQSRV
jgi:hypothetical protein